MSGVLHPMGPEPARTYWLRRGILLAVAAGLAIMVVAAVSGLTKAAVATAPPPVIAGPASSPSPSATSTGPRPGSGSPSPSTSTTTSTTTSTPAGASTPSTPSTPTTPSTPSAVASASTGATPRAKAAPSATPTPTTTVVGTPDCQPKDLRVTLKGDRSLSPGQNNKLTVSLVNAGPQTCLVSVTDQNFELKIYSGTDRIWSSRDCTKSLDGFDNVLAAKADVSWRMTWNGERSVKGANCRRGSGTPKVGTYWATAHLKGAKPVQLRMIIS